MQNTSSPRRGVRGSAPGSGGLMSAALAPIHCLVHTASAPNQTQHRHERAGAESGAGNRRRAAHTADVASSPSPALRRCVIDETVDEHVGDDTASSSDDYQSKKKETAHTTKRPPHPNNSPQSFGSSHDLGRSHRTARQLPPVRASHTKLIPINSLYNTNMHLNRSTPITKRTLQPDAM